MYQMQNSILILRIRDTWHQNNDSQLSLKLVGVSAKDSIIDSKFLKDYFISKFDLRTTLIVYEIEMMDRLHQHDSKGLIERNLKWQCFVNSNEVMAQMAIEMYTRKGCFRL